MVEYMRRVRINSDKSHPNTAAVIAASKSPYIKVLALKAPGMGQTSRKIPNYKSDLDNKTCIKAGKNIKIPALIVHGTADADVEVEFGKELAKSIKNSKLELIDGADHRFTRREDFDKAISVISEFLIKKK